MPRTHSLPVALPRAAAVSLVTVLATLAAGACLAQSVNFSAGWNSGATHARTAEGWKSQVRPCYFIELHFRGFLSTDCKSRFGLEWNRQTVHSWPATPPAAQASAFGHIDFAMDSILLNWQRRLWGGDRRVLALSFSAGPSIFGDDAPVDCDALFCTNAHVRWSFVPGLVGLLEIYRGLALQVGGQYNLLLTEDDWASRPFKSGFLMSAGLAFDFHREQ